MAVRNFYNCDVLRYHVERLASTGLIGLGYTNAPASIAPVGDKKPVIGSNPYVLSVPDGRDGATFILDQSASVAAKCEITMHARAKKPIPKGWAFVAERNPTTDPEADLKGSMAPIGGYKGFGNDRGLQWYRTSKLEHKINTILDFISAAEALIERKLTSKGRIVMHSGSADGLLVGAVINMRLDLFGAAVAEVPFVDVFNTMSDETLPLTPPEWVEWGNPITDADACRRMRSYSPYDNVTAQVYPPILATAGISDPRVTY